MTQMWRADDLLPDLEPNDASLGPRWTMTLGWLGWLLWLGYPPLLAGDGDGRTVTVPPAQPIGPKNPIDSFFAW